MSAQVFLAVTLWATGASAQGWTYENISALEPGVDAVQVVVESSGERMWFAYGGKDPVDGVPNALHVRSWDPSGWRPDHVVSTGYEGYPDMAYLPTLLVRPDAMVMVRRTLAGGHHELVEDVFPMVGPSYHRLADFYQPNHNVGHNKGMLVLGQYYNGIEDRIRMCSRVEDPAMGDEVYCSERAADDMTPDAWREPHVNISGMVAADQDHVGQAFRNDFPITVYASAIDGTEDREILMLSDETGELTTVASEVGAYIDRPHIAADENTTYVVYHHRGSEDDGSQVWMATRPASGGAWSHEQVSDALDRASDASIVVAGNEIYVVYKQDDYIDIATRCIDDPAWSRETVDSLAGVESVLTAKLPLNVSDRGVHVVYSREDGGQMVARWAKRDRISCP